MTATEKILECLSNSPDIWFIPEELKIERYSLNNICTRLPELARLGKVKGRMREGKNYKEWQTIHEVKFDDMGQGRLL